MTVEDYDFVLEELQKVIDDAKVLIARFEDENADQTMPAEYDRLHEFYQRAVKSQRVYTYAMLDALEPGRSSAENLSDLTIS